MNILVLCHDIPSPSFSETSSIYHLILNLHKSHNHNIRVICFDSGRYNAPKEIVSFFYETPIKFHYHNSFFKTFFSLIKNEFNISNLKHKIKNRMLPNLLDIYFSKEMDDKIKSVVGEFDLVYLTRPMANYGIDLNLPKVIQPYDAVYKWHEQIYKASKGYKKFVYLISYSLTKHYEKNIYEKFDACLVVTEIDKMFLEFLNPNINCHVIPVGVDIEYFSPKNVTEDFPSLIFLSNMSGSPTTENVLNFYERIYSIIQQEIPAISLFLVGRDPVPEIIKLSSDSSVEVTGFVDDVRIYLDKSSIFIAPMIMGTGMKFKVLEAMSMCKPVVSTSIGAQGIKIIHGENMIIADDEREFAECVVNLINDKEMRNYLGLNARKVIEEEYSWPAIADKLNQVFLKVINKI